MDRSQEGRSPRGGGLRPLLERDPSRGISRYPEGPLVPPEDGFWGVNRGSKYLLRRYLDPLGYGFRLGNGYGSKLKS